MVNRRISEKDLVDPAVRLIAEYGDPEAGITISDLSPLLRAYFRPSYIDLKILMNRRDDRLSQVIRNLVSHRTLVRAGLATFQVRQGKAGAYVLTERGWHRALELLGGPGTPKGRTA
jgi:hypothetical protein